MANSLDMLNQILVDAAQHGVVHNFTSDEEIKGSKITIHDAEVINFGSCSYLGLEYHSKIKEGIIEKTQKFGSQFSTSRTYLSLGIYEELESYLEKIFEKPVIASASTTLGHFAALPVVVEEGDAVILDLQVHSSVQLATQILKAKKIPTYVIPHNSMKALESKIKSLQNKHKKIWYLADGVYSMYGDAAPLKELEYFMNTYKQFHLYIDDAHGMSWVGKNGVGYVRSKIEHHDKMILATSLNKSFASAGGVLVFPNEELRNRVKNCGSTLIFSGPIQPPMLGAAIASAKLHLSEDIEIYQKEIKDKIDFVNDKLEKLGLPQYEKSDTPLFFIPVGLPRITRNIVKRMKSKGFYMNSAAFPAVPMKKSGLRFMVNRNLSYEELENMLTTLQKEYVLGLEEENSSTAEVSKIFKIKEINIDISSKKEQEKFENKALKTTLFRSISEIDKQEWQEFMGHSGTQSYQNLLALEKTFSNHSKKENNIDFYYYRVTDAQNQIVLYSLFTISLIKDDMLSDAKLSMKIEEERKLNPYYLTSKQLMTGSVFSMGKSLYINKNHKQWKNALELFLKATQEIAEKENVSTLMIKDIDDKEYENTMLELGLAKMELLDNSVLYLDKWNTHEEYLQTLSSKYRYSLKKEILAYKDYFEVSYEKPRTGEEKQQCFELYQQVFEKSYEMNVFELPYQMFERMFEDDNYDIIRLYLKDNKKAGAVGMLFSYKNGKEYSGLLVGLNYDYVREFNVYKQILYQSVLRAKNLGCSFLDLAFTAEMEKKKVGAEIQSTYGFVQAEEHYSHAVLETVNY
ncbi:bifunctional aminotransferase class I/II-fold pyridoxal phosphate-dependent enzyme/GNAT family N-acetyltransferase [Bernardetia sp.]|uniref:bifunctional aminotransferase class I/II-fold pyridoxal phosphate-dependent enzyme/GNAT family N-acetyltransferase n=1 Tax=Bernardetia sp. TaxID=1937974 RepID=UPI0025BC2971|nr:bifunctional aminotransferase class I/II-fold pyridoxal phosphate-dependent enzyme/GNAT family N-acetyltransferase [Bernardetia sp.]